MSRYFVASLVSTLRVARTKRNQVMMLMTGVKLSGEGLSISHDYEEKRRKKWQKMKKKRASDCFLRTSASRKYLFGPFLLSVHRPVLYILSSILFRVRSKQPRQWPGKKVDTTLECTVGGWHYVSDKESSSPKRQDSKLVEPIPGMEYPKL
jgi:hypothetical protein